MVRAPLCFVAALVMAAAAAVGRAEEKPDQSTDIPKLIARLADKRFAVRQEAARQLRALGKDAVPGLLRAADDPAADADLRKEVDKLLDQLLRPTDDETAKRQLARLPELAKGWQVSRLVETLAVWHDHVGRDEWLHAQTMARALADYAGNEAGRRFKMALPDLNFYRGERITNLDRGGVVLADTFDWGGAVTHCGIAASRFVTTTHWISNSIVLCNSDATPGGLSNGCVVVVGGDLILKNKRYTKLGHVDDSVVICGGDVQVSIVDDAVVLARGTVTLTGGKSGKTLVREQDTKTFEKVHLFSAAMLGLKVAAETEGLRVAEVQEGSVFQRAGFKPNDRIRAVNGRAVSCLTDLDRLLCRTTVDGSVGCFVTIARNTEQLYLPIPVNDLLDAKKP